MRRRSFLAHSGSAVVAGVVGLGCREPRPSAEPSAAPADRSVTEAAADARTSGPDPMDDALEMLREYGPGGGNHAPMGAEALIAIGRGAMVTSWVASYIRRENMIPLPAGRVLAPEDEPDALGKRSRIGDWTATMRAQVREQSWQDALRARLPQLLPGLAGAATHGIIRTAHAVRSIGRRDTAIRRRELADALAYWAAYHQPIAAIGEPSNPTDVRLASVALPRVPIVPAASRVRGMGRSLAARATDEAFLAIANRVNPGAAIGEFLSDLTATFARQYVVHGSGAPIPFIHAITGPAAIRPLLPHLSKDEQRNAMMYAWQTAAGLHASFAAPTPKPPAEVRPASLSTSLTRAADGGDVHAIKLAEVCWREWNAHRDPAYAAAAHDVALRL